MLRLTLICIFRLMTHNGMSLVKVPWPLVSCWFPKIPVLYFWNHTSKIQKMYIRSNTFMLTAYVTYISTKTFIPIFLISISVNKVRRLAAYFLLLHCTCLDSLRHDSALFQTNNASTLLMGSAGSSLRISLISLTWKVYRHRARSTVCLSDENKT